jgi:hypothetical protein
MITENTIHSWQMKLTAKKWDCGMLKVKKKQNKILLMRPWKIRPFERHIIILLKTEYYPTLQGRILLDKIIVFKTVKKSSAYYCTRRFITVLTRAHQKIQVRGHA